MKITRYNIDTSAVLVEFNASVWTARKLDKGATDEIVHNKNAKAHDAARVNKHLMAGRKELELIQSKVTAARTFVYTSTLPWSDTGIRLLPAASLLNFRDRFDTFKVEFDKAVKDFLKIYPTLVSAQAMALGEMFKREDYPTVDKLQDKFDFRIGFLPVPTKGDFRIDVGNAAQKELAEQLEKLTVERVEKAHSELYERLKDHLTRMVDRLAVDTVEGEVKPRRFHDTLVSGGLELCDLLKSLNICGDADLENARQSLYKALNGLDPDDLRKDLKTRKGVLTDAQKILDKFSF